MNDAKTIADALGKGGWGFHDFQGSDLDQYHDPEKCRVCKAYVALERLEMRLKNAEQAQP